MPSRSRGAISQSLFSLKRTAGGRKINKSQTLALLSVQNTTEEKKWTHLDVPLVRALVSVHALYRHLVALPHVDAEEWPPPHGILDPRVVGGQVHPANDEQPVNLERDAWW